MIIMHYKRRIHMERSIIHESDILKTIMTNVKFYVCILDYNGEITYIDSKLKKIINNYDKYDADYFFDKFDVTIIDNHKLNFDYIRSIDYSKKEECSMTAECSYKGEVKYLFMDIDFAAKSKKYILSFRKVSYEYIDKMKTQLEREKHYNMSAISAELKNKSSIIKTLTQKEREHLMYLKDVINNISEGIIVIDCNGKVTLCNNAVYSIIESSVFDIMNYRNISSKFKVTNADDCEDKDVLKNCRQFFKEHKPVRNLVLCIRKIKNGKIKYVELNSNPIKDNNQNMIYTIITIKDITASKIHQIAFENQAKFVKDVINTIDVPIAVITYPGENYNIINIKFNKLKKSIMDSISEEDISSTVKTGEEHILQPVCVKDEYDNKKYYKIKLKSYENENCKTIIHVIGIDVTDEINHARELEKVNNLKDEFFAMISHELRTPITIIYSSLQLANSVYKNEITPNIQKTLFRIEQNCARLLKLVNNILDISKAEAGFLTLHENNFDIVEATESIVESSNFYSENKQIKLIFDTNTEECPVTLDRDKYEKILLNLLSNAVKFTPKGKMILVTLNIREDFFYLSVKDEGIGIPKDKINYIFNRFAQVDSSLSRRAEGTGLGLSLTKELVLLMGAEINVISEEGKGSEFIVKFKRKYINGDNKDVCNSMGQTINDKISIEFSDIN